MQVVFKPRLPMGIFVSDVQGGRVSGVLDGQAKEQGLEPSGLQSEFQDWISFQFFSTFSSTSQHGAVVCVSRVDQRHFVMVSIDGQPYSSLPQQERNNNDSIVPPSGQVKLHSKQMPIRGEALLEEKKKGNVPYRVPGLVAVLRKSKEAIDKSFILYYINLYYI